MPVPESAVSDYTGPTENEMCVCPVCIYGPPSYGADPATMQIRTFGPHDEILPEFGDYNVMWKDDYVQTSADDVDIPLVCQEGATFQMLEKTYSGVLVLQGYKPIDNFTCGIADV